MVGDGMKEMLWFLAEVVRFLGEHILWVNLLLAVAVVFFERRNPKSVWAWLLLLYFVPVAGFLFYLLIGVDLRKRKRFQVKEVADSLQEAGRIQEHSLQTFDLRELEQWLDKYRELIIYNLKAGGGVLTGDNDIDIFTDGNKLYDTIVEDLEKATRFIHIQYYIIRDDILFERMREVLCRKIKEGVEVRILYDAMGCRTVCPDFWRKLKKQGMEVAVFFPALFGRFQLRMNYRNHRKLLIVDNEIAYVGGFNIGREYVDLDEKLGHWRDTHLRIRGTAILNLQIQFLQDWNYASGKNLFGEAKYYLEAAYGKRDACKVQIIASGPDHRGQTIRDNYLYLIYKARKSIYIQTPYFIPDEAVVQALYMAVLAGVEVNIMIPCKPDHMFVYWATYSYVGELVMVGANCYTYDNGFLHAKGMIVDGEVFCYGTANLDIRSFALNFEVNATVYDVDKAREMEECFKKDLKHCSLISKDVYAGRSLQIRFKEQICRLLSPVL